jgi:hypothetical protein
MVSSILSDLNPHMHTANGAQCDIIDSAKVPLAKVAHKKLGALSKSATILVNANSDRNDREVHLFSSGDSNHRSQSIDDTIVQ